MLSISKSTLQIMQTITWLMGVISVFVSVVLGFLIVYANNFLIRRRKKEIGIYMTLGMEKRKVVKLLLLETFLIGVLSLGAGLLTGVFLSQGLSVVTAKLFEVDMTGYRFIFSPEAFVKTIVYFGIIFLVVMAVSTISISKYKLISLINADRQNERQKLKNPVITVILFILSIVFIGVAYKLVLKNGIANLDRKLLAEVILGAVGTFLFFASLSGFFLKLLQYNKKLYLKGLNMFILRQINSRVNTAYISMSLICLMLFVTIGILSTGMGMNSAINKSYEYCAPYDASFVTSGQVSIVSKFKEYGFNLYDYTDKFVEFSLYKYSKENLTKKKVLGKVGKYIPRNTAQYILNSPLYLLKLSDYNKLMRLQKNKEVVLSENQVAVYSDYAEATPDLKKALMEFIGMNYSVTLSGKDFETYPNLITDGILTSPASGIMVALIVPDRMLAGSTANETMLSLNCKGDRKKMMQKLESDLYDFAEKYKHKKEEIKITGATKETVKSVTAGSKAIISFVGIYLGIIFLLASAAILALQQLSEAADNRRRYDILRKIGADDRLINNALFKQIAIYFMLPLSLSCIHSIVGIKVANDVVNEMGKVNAAINIIITAVLIVIVYGAYFLSTYFSSKRIVLKSRT
jgi:putative ABC transport system permease protein